jgi:type II secretory ATPase GspE/PulE/Tfp pilus assembly ATPase PilB-like protein
MSQKIITNLLNYAHQAGVSDLVITSQPEQIALDCYLPAGAQRHLTLPKKLEQEFFHNLRQILQIAPGELISRQYRQVATTAGEINLYLTILPDGNEEKIILNIINRPPQLWRLNQLGLRYADLRAVKKILSQPAGLVLITSPAGQGKSSTLYALLLELNDPSANIYLLAQHPPFTIPGVNLLNPTPANWERVRQHDSNIIFADSLDSAGALARAVNLAATGRLVIGTLTASDQRAALQQLDQLDLPKSLKSANLKMIISQKLSKLSRPANKQSASDRQLIGSFTLWPTPR